MINCVNIIITIIIMVYYIIIYDVKYNIHYAFVIVLARRTVKYRFGWGRGERMVHILANII